MGRLKDFAYTICVIAAIVAVGGFGLWGTKNGRQDIVHLTIQSLQEDGSLASQAVVDAQLLTLEMIYVHQIEMLQKENTRLRDILNSKEEPL